METSTYLGSIPLLFTHCTFLFSDNGFFLKRGELDCLHINVFHLVTLLACQKGVVINYFLIMDKLQRSTIIIRSMAELRETVYLIYVNGNA